MTPKLPHEHIFIPKEKRPKDIYQILRVYSRKWIVHPIKRRIAKYYLILLQKFFGIRVIGITGSVGKTTTKEMIAAILRQKAKTVASYKNIDPIYNIPMTILKCTPATRYLVLEMGVEFPDEMDFYLWLAKPSVAVIINIHPTHTEFLKNIDGVAKEKVRLIESLPKDGFAILNKENEYTRRFNRKTKAKVIWFGKKGEIKAEKSSLTRSLKTKFTLYIKKDKISIQLPVPGVQFVSNALAAASVSGVLGFSLQEIKNGLEGYSKPEHRMNILRLASGVIVLDDSYNNNPAGAKEALLTLKEIADNKKTIVVFGDMLELGKNEAKYHKQLGRFISSLGINYLLGVGKASKITTSEAKKSMDSSNVYWTKKQSQVDSILKPLLKRDRVVLVKGSRSIELDKLISRLS